MLEERLGGALRNDAKAKALLRWAAAEFEARLDAVTNPDGSHRDYRAGFCRRIIWGHPDASARRVEELRDASLQLGTFHCT
jgi:hypothetical protein